MTAQNFTVTESSTALESKGETFKAVLITPGLGSKGYYSEEMLRATGPEAFPKGTHSYLNHLSEGEKRSADKLLAVTTEDAYYEDGVGLVAELRPMSHWRDFINEVAPYVGLSISAAAAGERREVDGKNVMVVEALVPSVVNTVDLVSYAGRGGHIAEELVEAALQNAPEAEPEGNDMATVEEGLEALKTEVAKLVTAKEEAVAAADEKASVEEAVADAIKSAVAATRKVAQAQVSEKLADKLYARIEAGDFAIEEALAEYDEIRKEVKESLEEDKPDFVANIVSESLTSTDKTAGVSYRVGGWK